MNIDEEILLDEQETRREMAFIREQMPAGMEDSYDDERLSWVLDAIAAYYYESGILESSSDEVDVDMDAVASYVCSLAEQEGQPRLDAQEVRIIAEADLDFQQSLL